MIDRRRDVEREYLEFIGESVPGGDLAYLGARPGDIPTAPLTHEALVRSLSELVAELSHAPGMEADRVIAKVGAGVLDDVLLMLRWSAVPRNAEPDPLRAPAWYRSIDVVQIGWCPGVFLPSAEDRAHTKKNLAAPVWAALKTVCGRHRRALFVESVDVRAHALHRHLVRDHGFEQLPYYNFIWIPTTAHRIVGEW